MKLYKFYKIPGSDVERTKLSEILKYPLYAFTRYKKVAKEFEEMHKKGLFKLITTEVDKEEYQEFVRAYRGCALEYKPLDSYIRTNHVKVTYDVLMTLNEFNYIDSLCDIDAIITSINDVGLVSPDVFTKKYRKKLNKLCYENISKMNDLTLNFDNYPEEYVEQLADDISEIDWEYNTLNLYIGLYDEILNIDVLLSKLQ